MKKFALLLLAVVAVLAFSACSANSANQITLPPLERPTDSNSGVQPCKGEHAFVENSDLCTICGANYYSETLDFKLTDTRDAYILAGLGTCERTVIRIPATHKNKPVIELSGESFNAAVNSKCNLITEVYVPSSVKTSSANAFFRCEQLTKIEIEDGVTTIGTDAFRECVALESFRVPGTINDLPTGMLQHCTSLKTVEFGSVINTVASLVFYDCTSLESVVFEDGLVDVGNSAFKDCTSLKTVVLPSTLKSVKNSAFEGCTALEMNEYRGLGYLGNEVDPYLVLMRRVDENQKEAVIHDDARIIMVGAFTGTDIESLTLGKSITSIPHAGLNDLIHLKYINVAEGNPVYRAEGNCLIEIATKKLIKGALNSVIPGGGSVKIIGSYAFAYLVGLRTMIIPEGVEEFAGDTFSHCQDLESIVLCSTLKQMQLNEFMSCNKFTTVYYNGTSNQWKQIAIPESAGGGAMSLGDNLILLAATRYYYSEQRPTVSGRYWHYVDGVPTEWEAVT